MKQALRILAVLILALTIAPAQAKLARGSAVSSVFLPAGHWVAAQLPMTVIFPRPDSETKAYAREHWAFCDGTHAVQYVLPIQVKGGAYPYVYTLLSGPPGMSVGQNYWIPGDTPAQMYAAEYGFLKWTPQGNVTCPWTGTVSVLVTGQDLSTITVSFTLSTVGAYATSSPTANVTVNGTTTMTLNSGGPFTYGTVLSGLADIPTNDYIVGVSGTTYTLAQAATGSQTGSITGTLKSGFLFIDQTCTGCDTSGSGSIASPWQTLNKIYGASKTVTYPSAILYLRGNNSSVNYLAYDQTGGAGPGIELSGADNPVSVLGFPGDTTPDIDICGLNYSGDKDSVFYPFNDAGDLFIQNLVFSGQPGTIDGTCTSAIGSTTNHFSYIWVDYSISRLTFDNLSFPSVWSGSATTSGNSTDLEFDLLTWPSLRSYVAMSGISETGRLTGYQAIGIYDAYSTQYAIADFCSFQGSATVGVGYAYGRKDTDYDWTDIYDLSSGGAQWLFWQGGFVTSGANSNTNMEDAYNTIVSTAASPSTPGLIYNQSAASPSFTLNTYSYRNSVVGTGAGVAQGSTTGNGPFWFDDNAIQYGTTLAQGITFSTTGSSGYVGGAFPSNVTDATSGPGITACQAQTGVFNGSNQLTGACSASYLGIIGAQIQ